MGGVPVELLVAGIGGGIGIYTAAIALGIRHGIDWDHIAAITDITSATASVSEEEERWLIAEPGVMLVDESHHSQHGPEDHIHDHEGHEHAHEAAEVPVAAASTAPASGGATAAVLARPTEVQQPVGLKERIQTHREALLLGTLYA